MKPTALALHIKYINEKNDTGTSDLILKKLHFPKGYFGLSPKMNTSQSFMVGTVVPRTLALRQFCIFHVSKCQRMR